MFARNYRKILILFFAVSTFYTPLLTWAQVEEERELELELQIKEKTQAIQDLEKEILAYQEELKTIDGEKRSLQNEIKTLDITRSKLNADLSITENKISKTNLELESLAIDIDDKEERIGKSRAAIGEGLKLINEYDRFSFVENLLSTTDLNDVWETVDAIETVQHSIRERISTLDAVKVDLEDKQTESTRIKNELTTLRTQLANQRSIIDYNKRQKDKLLAETRNSETAYQNILNEKVRLRDAFEAEILDFESELQLLKDPSSIPEARHGMLSWPLGSIYVTQWFGDTSFSRSNPQIYNGHGHNGIDFRASVGTPIFSSADGEVVGSGNTDEVRGCYSYGKWVLVRHDNGLSTLYAHLSVISVSTGATVSRGGIIGYSGNTGYSTGPHLHFTVYATQGVEIKQFTNSRNCKNTWIPVADLRAYLNPVPYLPELP